MDNFKRFALHVAFGAAALAAVWATDNYDAIGLPNEYKALFITVATAAASFFRSKQVAGEVE